MSDANKPRQPSPKHTLEDILRSLQDLLHNELAEAHVAAKTESSDKTQTRAPAETRPTRASVSPPAAAEEAAPKLASTLEQMSIEWEDLPVLTDVVVPVGDEKGAAQVQRLAVQVIDRLNAELRGVGQAPLPPAIIERLARILREALAADLGASGQASK